VEAGVDHGVAFPSARIDDEYAHAHLQLVHLFAERLYLGIRMLRQAVVFERAEAVIGIDFKLAWNRSIGDEADARRVAQMPIVLPFRGWCWTGGGSRQRCTEQLTSIHT